MNKNVFDLGYKIVWVGHCRAHLQKIPDLPIVELYKEKYVDELSGRKNFFWNVRPLVISDEKIDLALPKNWKDKRFMGFRKFHELEEWLES